MKTISQQRDHEREKAQKIIDQRFADLLASWPDVLSETPTHQGADEEACQRYTANALDTLPLTEARLLAETVMQMTRDGFLEIVSKPGEPIERRLTAKGWAVAARTDVETVMSRTSH